MAYYDTGAMRTTASNIQSQLTGQYNPSKEAIDSIVNSMSAYFTDDVSANFAKKYNAEAKVTAESLRKLMELYISALNQTAEQYDKVINTGISGING